MNIEANNPPKRGYFETMIKDFIGSRFDLFPDPVICLVARSVDVQTLKLEARHFCMGQQWMVSKLNTFIRHSFRVNY